MSARFVPQLQEQSFLKLPSLWLASSPQQRWLRLMGVVVFWAVCKTKAISQKQKAKKNKKRGNGETLYRNNYDTAIITELHDELSCVLSQSGLFLLHHQDKYYSVKGILLQSALTMTWPTCFPFDSVPFLTIWDKDRSCTDEASCAADSVDSISTDKPNWVLMSTSWGNVPGLIVMAFIGHFLPPMKPSCHVNWMIPPIITESMTDGQISRMPAASRTLAEAVPL